MSRQVFISHSSIDKPIADAVCRALEQIGITCWIAPRDILPGQDWSEAIVMGIADAPVTILILSSNSNASLQVRREVQRAFERGKSVIPFRVEDIVPDGVLEYYLGPVHWLDAISPPLESHLPSLVAAVQKALPIAGEGPMASNIPMAPVPIAVPPPPRVQDNLPVAATPFIGREAEITAWLTQLMEPSTRVLTLVGFGGMGKTRAALELARRSLAGMPDGVWWLELEEAQTREEMLQRIVAALHLDLKPHLPIKEQLTSWLAARKVLLVLDNTEQIPEAGTVVHEIVAATADAKLLVTSRRALEIAAEHVVEIPPLSAEEAEALFINRAQARNSAFKRVPENAEDIAELCRRLEGMPLALELAASRITGLTPHEILNRLDERLRLLQTRAPHLPPRQRAIHGTIEWSHALLTEEDRDLFAQLAVFSNGFTLAAAETICDAFDVFEGVQELRRHSFLRSETQTLTQQVRFLMLELVREFAAQKLTKEDVRLQHAKFFLDYAVNRVGGLRTRAEASVLDELSVELDNLRAALSWARTSGENELCAQLSLVLATILYYRGFWNEARTCLQTGCVAAEALATRQPTLRAELGLRVASLALDRGEIDAAQAEADLSLELYQQLSLPGGVADALNLLGLIATEKNQHEDAATHFQHSLALRPEADHAGRAIALHNLARIAAMGGDRPEGQRLYQESLTHRRAAGDARGEAETQGNLGALAYLEGDLADARRLYYQSLELRRTLRDRQGIALMLYNLAELALRDDDKPRAVGLFLHAERIFRDLQSAFAGAAADALEDIAQSMGREAYDEARQTAITMRWENFTD